MLVTISAIQVMSGNSLSLTVTLNEHWAMPARLDAVTVTLVIPGRNALPLGGLRVTTGVGAPEAGTLYVSVRAQVPATVFVMMSAGQVTSDGVPIHTLEAVPVAETLATV